MVRSVSAGPSRTASPEPPREAPPPAAAPVEAAPATPAAIYHAHRNAGMRLVAAYREFAAQARQRARPPTRYELPRTEFRAGMTLRSGLQTGQVVFKDGATGRAAGRPWIVQGTQEGIGGLQRLVDQYAQHLALARRSPVAGQVAAGPFGALPNELLDEVLAQLPNDASSRVTSLAAALRGMIDGPREITALKVRSMALRWKAEHIDTAAEFHALADLVGGVPTAPERGDREEPVHDLAVRLPGIVPHAQKEQAVDRLLELTAGTALGGCFRTEVIEAMAGTLCLANDSAMVPALFARLLPWVEGSGTGSEQVAQVEALLTVVRSLARDADEQGVIVHDETKYRAQLACLDGLLDLLSRFPARVLDRSASDLGGSLEHLPPELDNLEMLGKFARVARRMEDGAALAVLVVNLMDALRAMTHGEHDLYMEHFDRYRHCMHQVLDLIDAIGDPNARASAICTVADTLMFTRDQNDHRRFLAASTALSLSRLPQLMDGVDSDAARAECIAAVMEGLSEMQGDVAGDPFGNRDANVAMFRIFNQLFAHFLDMREEAPRLKAADALARHARCIRPVVIGDLTAGECALRVVSAIGSLGSDARRAEAVTDMSECLLAQSEGRKHNDPAWLSMYERIADAIADRFADFDGQEAKRNALVYAACVFLDGSGELREIVLRRFEAVALTLQDADSRAEVRARLEEVRSYNP